VGWGAEVTQHSSDQECEQRRIHKKPKKTKHRQYSTMSFLLPKSDYKLVSCFFLTPSEIEAIEPVVEGPSLRLLSR
jgi:hypothetical protein